MLKLKSGVDIKELEKHGFKSFKVSRVQTNYYFACRDDNVIIVNNLARELYFDAIYDKDTRVHSVVKFQPRSVFVYDAVCELAAAGLIERV